MSENERVAIYPGTFDPVTNGHISLIERGLHLFDRLYVAVAKSAAKNPMFDYNERVELVKGVIADQGYLDRVEVIGFEGLLANLAVQLNATAIVRGLRAVSDFEYEFQMALMNRKLARDVETVFLMPALSWVYLSSTIVKDVALHGGDITSLVPDRVAAAIVKKNAR